MPFATVHEALQLSARLRLPSHISQQKEKTETFVREVSCLACAAGPAWRRCVVGCCGVCSQLASTHQPAQQSLDCN